MHSLAYAHKRLQAALEEIGRLHDSEFAYPHSKEALTKLEQILRMHLQIVAHTDGAGDPEQIKQKCCDALARLFAYVPLLGFILRSTNVRNAFEVFRPLLRLSGDLLEPGIQPATRRTRLILSSEWSYSPFTYPEIAALRDFVLIGLPAPESSNPLLVPLSGHELGHKLWGKKGLSGKLLPDIKQRITDSITGGRWKEYQGLFPQVTASPERFHEDIFAPETYAASVGWCTKQAEETFCDFVGLKLFGESFLRSFAYLLSPNSSIRRPLGYPGMLVRVRNLVEAANTGAYRVPVPAGYETGFKDSSPGTLSASDRFRLSLADETLAHLRDVLVSEVEKGIQESGVQLTSPEEVQRILKRFKRMIPAENCHCLADILNAGWGAFEDESFWDDGLWASEPDGPARKARKEHVLKELVLKNIEIFEMEQIKAGH